MDKGISPNPFWDLTRIPYEIPVAIVGSSVRLGIFDPAGRLVRALAAAGQTEGHLETVWDGRDDAGRPVRGGVYFCRIDHGGQTRTTRIILTR